MSDMPCRISDSHIQEPGDIPYTSSEDSERFSYRPYLYTSDQMAEALDELFEGEWRERWPAVDIAFDALDCDELREAAEDIRERDNSELQRSDLSMTLEDIGRWNESIDIALLRRQSD